MKGIPDRKKRSLIMSKDLKLVEVKCELVDEKVLNVLKFLNKFIVCKCEVTNISTYICFQYFTNLV